MEIKKVKCPICGKFETKWIDEISLKETHSNYLVWCCSVNDDEHWFKGNIFLSDMELNSLSIEESDKIRDKVREEELDSFDF